MLINEFNNESERIKNMIGKIELRSKLERDTNDENLNEAYNIMRKVISNISSETLETNLTIKDIYPQKGYSYYDDARITIWKRGLGIRHPSYSRTENISKDMFLGIIEHGSEKIIAEMNRLNRKKCTKRIKIAADVLKKFAKGEKSMVYEFQDTIKTNIYFKHGGWVFDKTSEELKIHNLSFSGTTIYLNDCDIGIHVTNPTDYAFIQYKYDEIMELLNNDIARLKKKDKGQKTLLQGLRAKYSKYLVAIELAKEA